MSDLTVEASQKKSRDYFSAFLLLAFGAGLAAVAGAAFGRVSFRSLDFPYEPLAILPFLLLMSPFPMVCVNSIEAAKLNTKIELFSIVADLIRHGQKLDRIQVSYVGIMSKPMCRNFILPLRRRAKLNSEISISYQIRY